MISILAMRRGGSWQRHDLNIELIDPLTRKLVSSWSNTFQLNLFSYFEECFNEKITILLQEFKNSIPQSLSMRAKDQIEVCHDIINSGMEQMLEDIQHAMDIVQRAASRSLLPHVRHRLQPGYLRAAQQHGPGAIVRQRVSIGCAYQHFN